MEGVKKDVQAYILQGKLFFLDKLDKKDIKNLYLFYESTVNSYGLKRASEAEKNAITPCLEEIYNYILETDKKVKAGIEITELDKARTQDLIEKLDKTLEENAKKDFSHQSTNLVKTSFLTSGNKVDGTLNENSAFYKSKRPGIKEAYSKLPSSQRTFLDNINTNNDDYIEDAEIKANGQYTLPLSEDNFIKPFYGKPEGNNVEVNTTEVAGTSTQTTSQPAQTPTTPQNPNGGVPETVTISQGQNEQGVKAEDAPTLMTLSLIHIYLTRMVSIQMATQIRMVQSSNSIMAEKIQTTIVTTIPLWKNQMVLALGMHHTDQAIRTQQMVTDLTNDLLKKNADTLKQNTIETARATERGIVDVETIKHTNEALISTIEEVRNIQIEGTKNREKAQAEIRNLEEELKKNLTRRN